MAVPTYDRMFMPTMEALRLLGGSASNEELAEKVAEKMGLTDKDLAETMKVGNRTRFEYRLAWARSYLKANGLISNSARGVWALTDLGRTTKDIDASSIKRIAKAKSAEVRPQLGTARKRLVRGEAEEVAPETDPDAWRGRLARLLLQLKSDQFERLCQRVLRESGFTQVQVLGRSGDGGIDGIGTVRLGGLLSFPILFQCKRYRGSIGPATVRDFRGAMVGRADRGLILTTGVFTSDSKREAARDGAPPIDLVDGEALIEKLRELKLGIVIEQVESVHVREEWFLGL